MAISMTTIMGKFVEYDESYPIGWSKYMRFREDLSLEKPLRRGMKIGVAGEASGSSSTIRG